MGGVGLPGNLVESIRGSLPQEPALPAQKHQPHLCSAAPLPLRTHSASGSFYCQPPFTDTASSDSALPSQVFLSLLGRDAFSFCTPDFPGQHLLLHSSLPQLSVLTLRVLSSWECVLLATMKIPPGHPSCPVLLHFPGFLCWFCWCHLLLGLRGFPAS